MSPVTWPRSRHGRAMDGCRVQLILHLRRWRWRPYLSLAQGEGCVAWLCLTVHVEAHYD